MHIQELNLMYVCGEDLGNVIKSISKNKNVMQKMNLENMYWD